MAAITIWSDFGAQKNKVCHCFHCFPIYFPWSDGTRCHDLRFLNVELQANFFTLHFHFIKRLFNSSSLSAIRVVSSAYLRQSWFQPVLLPAWHFVWYHLYVESKIWHKWTYPWNRNRLRDLKNELMVSRRTWYLGSLGWTGTHCYI